MYRKCSKSPSYNRFRADVLLARTQDATLKNTTSHALSNGNNTIPTLDPLLFPTLAKSSQTSITTGSQPTNHGTTFDPLQRGRKSPNNRNITPLAITKEEARIQAHAKMNHEMSRWLDKRTKTRDSVEGMGMSLSWMLSKQRNVIEERQLAKTINRNQGKAVIPRKQTPDIPLPKEQYVANPGIASSNFPRISNNAALLLLRAFLRTNKFRLYHYFTVSGMTQDYRLTMDEIANFLERVGSIKKQRKLRTAEYLLANEVKGTLNPITSNQLKELLHTYPVDSKGRMDYRLLLEDFHGQQYDPRAAPSRKRFS
eukprot:m.39418 g.39418  ORF g.39418 m.39418 type:complete len:312 (+) comp9552_c0_seq2:226-1161(+)